MPKDKHASHVLSWLAIVSALSCLAILVYQSLRIKEIADSQQRLSSELDSVKGQLIAQQSADKLSDDVASLRLQFANLSRYLARMARESGMEEDSVPFTASLSPAALAPGVYVLGPQNGTDDDEEDAYTIYHISAIVRAGTFERALQFAAARSGFLSWQFYFDYDNDGLVDTDMLREFAESIPFGDYVSGSLDRDRSQRIYDRFLESSHEAEYTPPERIDEQSGEIAQQLWSFITGTSERLARWMRGRLESETPTAEGRESD